MSVKVESNYQLEGPNLTGFDQKQTLTNRNIFKLSKEDLQLFFLKQNIKLPDNLGECRNSLNILKECGYNQGLCRLLGSDPETGISGDAEDIKRRQVAFGKHSIALPEIESFSNLLARNFEDINVICLIWAASIYLLFSMFSSSEAAYFESLTIYSGLLFSTMVSAFCDWVKERQYLKLRDEINNQFITVFRGVHGTVL